MTMLDAALTELTQASERVFDGSFLHVQRDTVRLPNGAHVAREYILHPGAVMIVPVLDNGELVMERQYRHPLARVFLEFPAGKLDANERPESCALRELQEETGYRASELAHLGDIHNAIAYSDEVIHLYAARGLKAGQAQLDEHEFVETLPITLEALLKAIRNGKVTDVKTIIGAYWWSDVLSGAKPVHWSMLEPAVMLKPTAKGAP